MKIRIIHCLRISGITFFGCSLALAQSNTSPWPSSGNVGIGTTSPGAFKLNIQGTPQGDMFLGGTSAASLSFGNQNWSHRLGIDTSNRFYISANGQSYLRSTWDGNLLEFGPSQTLTINSGNVGIGTSGSAAKLAVLGPYVDINTPQLDVDGGSSGAVLTLSTAGIHRGKVRVDSAGGIAVESSGTGGVAVNYSGGTGDTTFWNGQGAGLMVIKHDGTVGIGTSSPTQKLSVNGTVRAKEVIVETTGWSDYVFEDTYKLQPLSDVEMQIRRERHLPGIPSAHEVVENGVGIGEMQAKLLAKVEELTLYMIQLKKENEQLKERVSSLEAGG